MKRPTHWVFRYGRHNAPSYAHNFTTSSQTGSKLWRERLRRSPLGTEHSGRLKRVLVRKLPRKCDQMNSMLQCYRWDVVFFVCLWWRRARTWTAAGTSTTTRRCTSAPCPATPRCASCCCSTDAAPIVSTRSAAHRPRWPPSSVRYPSPVLEVEVEVEVKVEAEAMGSDCWIEFEANFFCQRRRPSAFLVEVRSESIVLPPYLIYSNFFTLSFKTTFSRDDYCDVYCWLSREIFFHFLGRLMWQHCLPLVGTAVWRLGWEHDCWWPTGHHQCVAVINNFIPREEIERHAGGRDDDAEKIPHAVVPALHRLAVQVIFPASFSPFFPSFFPSLPLVPLFCVTRIWKGE